MDLVNHSNKPVLNLAPPPSTADKLRRGIWGLAWFLLFRPSPIWLHVWRRMLLRLFGAKIGTQAHPYPSSRIWAPWNLTMGDRSCLAADVDCYCVAPIVLGHDSIVSQRAHLCAASHDFRNPAFPLVLGAITIADGAWVASEAFIGPGVTIGGRAVVGARAVVNRDVAPETVVAGNPAVVVSKR